MPAVIRFLGYNPLQAPTTIAERLKAKRRELGWTQKTAARKLGVNPCTWSDWERGRVILPSKKARNCATVLSRVSCISITMSWMIDRKLMLQAHTSLQIRAPVQANTTLA
jgi:transcriptional regulator with XRE-family HTH domain